jgi:hypothetical protein
MITAKTAKTQLNTIKEAAVETMSHITTNEKIVGAAVIGVAVGAAATAIGSSLLHGSETPAKTAKPVAKAPAAKD